MSKELIERLREAAAQRVASTAMIGADDLIAAADALESLEAAYASAVEAGKALAKQALKAEQERDAQSGLIQSLRISLRASDEILVRLTMERDVLTAELKGVREQLATAMSDAGEFSHQSMKAQDELKALREQEPETIDWPNYHHDGMGCGLEDRGITDRYEAMRHGWDCAIERMAEILPDELYARPVPARAESAIETPAKVSPASTPPLPHHVFRELVNDLRDLAKQFHGHESLRDRISGRLAQDVPEVSPCAGHAAQLPDPLGLLSCTHPDCGRYEGPRSHECRAMADNACARPSICQGHAAQQDADALLARIARAIWGLRREEEDRCDMELEDMPHDHSVWKEAKAAIEAMKGGS